MAAGVISRKGKRKVARRSGCTGRAKEHLGAKAAWSEARRPTRSRAHPKIKGGSARSPTVSDVSACGMSQGFIARRPSYCLAGTEATIRHSASLISVPSNGRP